MVGVLGRLRTFFERKTMSRVAEGSRTKGHRDGLPCAFVGVSAVSGPRSRDRTGSTSSGQEEHMTTSFVSRDKYRRAIVVSVLVNQKQNAKTRGK